MCVCVWCLVRSFKQQKQEWTDEDGDVTVADAGKQVDYESHVFVRLLEVFGTVIQAATTRADRRERTDEDGGRDMVLQVRRRSLNAHKGCGLGWRW